MPTYGYECRSCKHTFDIFQSMKDEPLKTCPECGKEIRRLINGGTGVIFKGNGFYVTDKNGKSAKTAGDGSKTTETKTAGTESAACAGCAKSGAGGPPPACPKAVNS